MISAYKCEPGYATIEDDCDIEDVCDQFRAGELKEDALTEGEEHEE